MRVTSLLRESLICECFLLSIVRLRVKSVIWCSVPRIYSLCYSFTLDWLSKWVGLLIYNELTQLKGVGLVNNCSF